LGSSTPSAHSSAPPLPPSAPCADAELSSNTSYPGEKVEPDELQDAITTVEVIIDGAEQLLSHLGIFSAT